MTTVTVPIRDLVHKSKIFWSSRMWFERRFKPIVSAYGDTFPYTDIGEFYLYVAESLEHWVVYHTLVNTDINIKNMKDVTTTFKDVATVAFTVDGTPYTWDIRVSSTIPDVFVLEYGHLGVLVRYHSRLGKCLIKGRPLTLRPGTVEAHIFHEIPVHVEVRPNLHTYTIKSTSPPHP